MQAKRENYDKGNTRTIDEREEELLLWLNSCDLQRFYGEEIGIKQSSLERVGLSKGGVVLNKKACIRAGELIRSKVRK